MPPDPLPMDAILGDALDLLGRAGVLVLAAPPGSGKTTRVPPAVLASGVLAAEHPRVVLLQPRRVAARAAAARIAEERGGRVGGIVGYQVRFDRRIGPETRLEVVTEGILTRRLLVDPFLAGIGAVVLDEFHERGIHTDLALALLQEIRRTVRPDLKLIVMSATLETSGLASFLDDCPVLRSEGRAFPVATSHLATTTGTDPLPDRVRRALEAALLGPDEPGDILVFLPGLEEIRRCARALASLAERHDLLVLPLHGSLPAADQDRVLRPADRRKLILATNVAETSLTIDGVQTVIDSGLARVARFDPATGLDRLELTRISKASATQRSGRAGRTAPGRCIRLWSPRDEKGMPDFETPEIQRVDLSAAVLALHAWGYRDPRAFGWFEPPAEESLARAERTLTLLGALDSGPAAITPLGKELLALPVHPRIGRLLLAADALGRPREGAALAALLSEKDIFTRNQIGGPAPNARRESDLRGDCDLRVRLDRIEEERAAGIDPAARRRVVAARDQLMRIIERNAPPDERLFDPSDDALLKALLLAFPDRVVRRRSNDLNAGVMVGGRGIRLDPTSVVRDSEFFLALDPHDQKRQGRREARVRIASAIKAEWLDALFPEAIRRERVCRYDPEHDRVIGSTITWYHDLPLREAPHGNVDEAQAAEVLAEALRDVIEPLVRGRPDVSNWLTRLESLTAWRPDLDLPRCDGPVLHELLRVWITGCRSAADVARLPWIEMLRSRLTPRQARALDELAPEVFMLPSGRRARLVYEPDRPPLLEARVQELFGWLDTPRIAGEKVKLLVRLLGPNGRPVQITDDLASFWATTYFQVRKDLRARYPKHAWPDDPRTAQPRARGNRA